MIKKIGELIVLRIVLGAVIFITDILLARYLGPTLKGYYYILVITPTTFGFAAGLGMDYALNYFGHQHPDRLFSIFLSAFLISIIAVSIIVLFLSMDLFHINTILYRSLPEKLSNSVIFSMALIPVQAALTLAVMTAMTAKRPEIAVKTRILRRTSLLVLIILVFALLGTGQRNAIFFLLTAQVVAYVLCIIFCLWRIGFRFMRKRYPYTPLVKEGLKAFPARLTERLQVRIGGILLGILAGGNAVGLYSVSLGISEVFYYVSGSTASVLFSTRAKGRGMNEHLLALRIMLPFSMLGAVAIGICAQYLIPIVYGESFSDCRAYVWYILPGSVAYALIQTLAPFLVQRGESRILSMAMTLGLVVMITLNLLLAPILEAAGAALAYSISFVSSWLIILYASVRHTSGVKISDLIVINKKDIEIMTKATRDFLKKKGI